MILNRRTLLGGASTAIAGLALARLAPAMARPTPAFGGCFLCDRARLNYSGSESTDTGPLPSGTVLRSSGDPETDKFLGLALLRLATTFEVAPGFGFYDDRDGENAFATPDSLTAEEGFGTVLMGENLFRQLMSGDNFGMTVLAVCAHEFGHIHQMRQRYMASLVALDTTIKPVELHADFLAGYFLALRKADHPELNIQTVGAVYETMGDNAFTPPGHHGTSRERSAAILAGFNQGRSGGAINQAAQAGVAYVRGVV
jgi:hypothetical protein